MSRSTTILRRLPNRVHSQEPLDHSARSINRWVVVIVSDWNNAFAVDLRTGPLAGAPRTIRVPGRPRGRLETVRHRIMYGVGGARFIASQDEPIKPPNHND